MDGFTNPKKALDACFTPVFFARQPIFDVRKNIWGYELLYRDAETSTAADITDKHFATLNVISNVTSGQFQNLRNGRKFLINFSNRSLLDDIPLILSPYSSVVEITEDAKTGSSDLKRILANLKSEGYLLALDALDDFDAPEIFLPLVDVVIVDVLGKSNKELAHVLSKIPGFKGNRLAKRVETRQDFNRAKKLGFSLFQGYFFQRPEIIPGRRLSSAHKSRFQILKLVEETEPRIGEISRVIQADVSLSYRLLTYLNSVAFSFPCKVRSIRHAVVLLGWRQVRHWLRLIILTDLSSEGAGSKLSLTAAQRGKFLELVCRSHPELNEDPDSLFMLGLLSLLETMLGMPMNEVVDGLPLSQEFKDVLVDPGHSKRPWLSLPVCFEQGDWTMLDLFIEELHLDPVRVANSYYDSLVWANHFFELTV